MKVELLVEAKSDLKIGFLFYETRQVGLGKLFLSTLQADIDSLGFLAGVHPEFGAGFLRMLSKRFPYAIYYKVVDDVVKVFAVLDCRRNPSVAKERLR